MNCVGGFHIEDNCKLGTFLLHQVAPTLQEELHFGSCDCLCLTGVFSIKCECTCKTIGGCGPRGREGRDGRDGQDGLNGLNGENGPRGFRGRQGRRGSRGHTGPTGADGSTGSIGPTGPIGSTGSAGPTGAGGTTGNTGTRGGMGPTGLTGAGGATGADGAAGSTGASGPTGALGSTGTSGSTGARGQIGVSGAQGPVGLSGAQGAQGIRGPRGCQGVQGPIGPQGAAGASDCCNMACPNRCCPTQNCLRKPAAALRVIDSSDDDCSSHNSHRNESHSHSSREEQVFEEEDEVEIKEKQYIVMSSSSSSSLSSLSSSSSRHSRSARRHDSKRSTNHRSCSGNVLPEKCYKIVFHNKEHCAVRYSALVQFQLCVVERPLGSSSYHGSFTAPLIELYEKHAPEAIVRCRFDCTSEALFCLLEPTLLALLCLNPKTCKLVLLDNFLVLETNGFGAFGTHTRIVQTLERSRLRSYASFPAGATTLKNQVKMKTCCYEPDHQDQCALSFSARVLEPIVSTGSTASALQSNQRHKDHDRINIDDDDDFPTQVCTYLVRFTDGCTMFTTKVRTVVRVRETSVCHLDSKESRFNWVSQKFGWLTSSPVISLVTTGACMGISRKFQNTVFGKNDKQTHHDSSRSHGNHHNHRNHNNDNGGPRRRRNSRRREGNFNQEDNNNFEPFHNVLQKFKAKYNNTHPALHRHEGKLYDALLRPFM